MSDDMPAIMRTRLSYNLIFETGNGKTLVDVFEANRYVSSLGVEIMNGYVVTTPDVAENINARLLEEYRGLVELRLVQ